MKNYLELLSHVLHEGVLEQNRTDTPALAVFGGQLNINLAHGFPLLTTKKIFFKGIIHELLWFLRGSTNVKELQEHNVHIWDEWADKNTGELGPIYGYQWRKWTNQKGETIDQISQAIRTIRHNPSSRRILVSAWNVGDLPLMKLQPCHCLFQFGVINNTLSCHLYQRSADIFLGVPFNIASYALLTHMIAHVTGLKIGNFVHSFGNLHLYQNHIEQAKTQLKRTPSSLPQISLNPLIKDVFDFSEKDIHLENYHPQPSIKAPIAV
jgi:thymidylate synthase